MFCFLHFFRVFSLNSFVVEKPNLHFTSSKTNPVISFSLLALFSFSLSLLFFSLEFPTRKKKKYSTKKSSCPFIFSRTFSKQNQKQNKQKCPSSSPRNLEDLPNLLLLRSASCSSLQSPAASHFSYWLLLTLKQSSSPLRLRRHHPKHHRPATPPSFLHPTSFSPTSILIKTPPSAPPLASVAAAVSPFLQALLQLLLLQQTITTTTKITIIIKNRTTTTMIIKTLKI